MKHSINRSLPAARWGALQPLLPFAYCLALCLIGLSLFRFGFMVWQWDRVTATDGVGFILLQGIRFDLLILSGLLVIPLFLTPLIALSKSLYPRWAAVVRAYLWLVVLLLLFMEMATPNFLSQFDARPNILFVEYLKYPREVLSMLWVGYKLPLLLAAVIIPICGIWLWRCMPRVNHASIRWYQSFSLALVLLLVAAMGIRSSVGHRPANPSLIAFSNDLMANDLALNSTYSLLYAIYESKHDEEGDSTYGEMDSAEMLAIVKDTMAVDSADFVPGDVPTLHVQKATQQRERPKNIVIVLEESLGAEFVGRLGGKPVTPNLDRLGDEGIWFENLYATGTRSVRGIEAVITGFTPTPAQSVVKLNKSQRDFFTFAELLRRQGFDTSFIYGGEAHFDNMQRFFMNNGFNRVVDQHDYKNPVFSGSWGASDEDLFNKAHEVFSQQGDKPFFSLVFTSTNHSPFEFPDGRIELYDAEKATENNAVKYADFALGQFFEKAKKSNYWDNTLFLVVADHNSRVRGANLVPIKYFHIPGLILGGGVEPNVVDRLTSQIDLLPTLLSMAGISGTHPAIGYDLTHPATDAKPGRAMMQYNATQAYREGDQVVIFEKEKEPKQYQYVNGELILAAQQDQALIRKALAHSLFGTYSYNNKSYYLPKDKE